MEPMLKERQTEVRWKGGREEPRKGRNGKRVLQSVPNGAGNKQCASTSLTPFSSSSPFLFPFVCQRVRKLYRVRRTLQNLFSAAHESTNYLLQSIEADKVLLGAFPPPACT
jgi:hypothetical protein